MSSQTEQIKQIIENAQHIVVVQADNPDADSLGSALALEHILGEMGKQVSLYCGIDMPSYLRYLDGWDRVSPELPKTFDASIIVDASTMSLFEKLVQSQQKPWLAAKPCIVLDHHESVDNLIPFATVTINDGHRASAGELIYLLAQELGWGVPIEAMSCIMSSILGDTQGLTNQLASAETYRIMSQMVEAGVNRPALEEKRRAFSKMVVPIYKFKALLINRTEFDESGEIATVMVPQVEITQYSPLYNPGPLVQSDMLQVEGVRVAIVFKSYDDGKITAAIRCNSDAGIAAELAEHFGGGGHAFASGFKITSGRPFNEVKSECISFATELLAKLNKETPDETTQHPNQTD